MATTDEDLQKKQDHVVDLRQKVAEANATRETHERGLSNDITAAALDAEAARLEIELTEALHLAKVAESKSEVKSVEPEAKPFELEPKPAVTVAPVATIK